MGTSLARKTGGSLLGSLALVALVLLAADLYSDRFEFKSNPTRILGEMEPKLEEYFIRLDSEPLYRKEALQYKKLHREYVEMRSSLYRMLLDGNTRFFHYRELLKRSRAVVWIPCLLIGVLLPWCFSGRQYWIAMSVPLICVLTGVFVVSYLWIFMIFTYLGAKVSEIGSRLLFKA